MVRLEEITNVNVWDVCRLRVYDEQKSFVAENVQSLAEAYATRNEGNVAMPFAVYDDERLIGFVMLGYNRRDDAEAPEYARGSYCLWRFMIDWRFQHRGYAKLVLEKVIEFIRTQPCGEAKRLWLSYEPDNAHGREVYRKFGFCENGELCGGEVVAVYEL